MLLAGFFKNKGQKTGQEFGKIQDNLHDISRQLAHIHTQLLAKKSTIVNTHALI